MLKWLDVLKYANLGNPEPARRVEKSLQEWEAVLSPAQFQITRLHGTERAHSSDMCYLFEPARYACVCCGTELFDSGEKFDSGTGWPSFTQPLQENAISYHKDSSHGMVRIEVRCNTCDAHLGHVFQDGPPPSELRYCINAIALQKIAQHLRKATFGGGCFWCTEAIFQQLKGVESVSSGYSGGHLINPSYRLVCSGTTGHAEAVELSYDPDQISFADLLRIHLVTHDPTTPNQQGADKGTQYRSIIFYRDEAERATAEEVLKEVQAAYPQPIVTELRPFEAFFPAEAEHQDFYNSNSEERYCRVVIEPKLQKFRKLFQAHMKD